jgi:hypothetical protein
MWCGRCYSSEGADDFHVADPENLFSNEGDEDRIQAGWRTKESDRRRYSEARDGDDLLVPFECYHCVFAKVTGRKLVLENTLSAEDAFLVRCIVRVTLDAFWSRARSTVAANTRTFREMISISSSLGFEAPFESPGPLPAHDHCGYKVAILMVAKSTRPGRHSDTHVQWDTIRKYRSTISNQSRASRVSNYTTWSMTDYKGSGYDRLSSEACGSLWFHRFSVGCRKRMGQDWRPNRAISTPLMLMLLSLVEVRIRSSGEISDRAKWVMAGSYFCFCYVVSLRSSEGLMVDVAGISEFGEASEEHVVIPLLGQVKGEHHTRQHLIHCVNVTDSGIHVRRWVSRLRAIHRISQRTTGPAFVNPISEHQTSTSEMNDLFIELLAEIYDDHRDLFAVDIRSASDLADNYHVYRSFRRGSETRAVSMEVSMADRYQVNRWRKKEKATGSKMAQPIDQMYVDVSLVKEAFLRYTQAM